MQQTQLVAFDDHMSSSGLTETATSSDQDALTMGMFDQIAFTVTAEQIRGSNPALQVQVWHSADGINWLTKAAAPEVPYQYFNADGTNVYVGFDDGSMPTLRYVRFVLTITVDAPGFDTAVRIDAVLNDSRESAFSTKMHKILQQQDMNKCASYIQGGEPITDPATASAIWNDKTGVMSFESSCTLTGPLQEACTLAPDASVCVNADGSATLSSPRQQIGIPQPGTPNC